MKKLITLVAAMAMVATFAMTAAAAEWNFFGSARVNTTWTDVEKIGSTDGSTDNFVQAVQSNSRIGATVKVNDNLTGGFEYGSTPNLRKLYGEWNFGSGKLLAGQTYTPVNWFYSNQIYADDSDLLFWGGVYSGRAPMLQLTFGDFKIAAITSASDALIVGAVDGAVVGGMPNTETDDFDTAKNKRPAIEASYSLNFGDVNLDMAGGYQTWELSNGTSTIDIDSWVVALGGTANFGIGYLKASIYTGVNSGHMISMKVNADANNSGLVQYADGKRLDNDCLGYLVVAGAKINEMFSVEFGYAGVQTELDGNKPSDDARSYYAQTTVTLAPGVFFVPEIGVVDYDENGQKETTYAAVKWQINF